MDIFSRQEVLKLVGLSSGQLSRLDGSDKHPVVLYTLEQLFELRIIAALRKKLSMQEIRKVVDHIRDNAFDKALFGKFFIFCDNQLYWVQSSDSMEDTIVRLTGKHRAQVVMKAVDPIGDIMSDLQKELERRDSAKGHQKNHETDKVAAV
jgi:DNA-binding transcriptional MerR regulator